MSGELIETVIGLMPDAAVVIDEGGSITHANESLCRLFGYEASELIGERIEVLVPERLRSVHRGHRQQYADDPRTRAMGADLNLFGRRRDGSEFPVDISLARLSLGGEHVVAAVRDVSDRREAETVRAHLAAIVESSGDAIFAMGADGVVRSWNPSAEHTLGYAPSEVVGAHVSRLIPPEAAEDFEDQLAVAMQGQPHLAKDTIMRTKDGRLLPVAVLVSSLRTGDDLSGFSVVARDISVRKQTEAELRRLLDERERNANWQAITAEIRLCILDGNGLASVLGLACERLAELIDARGIAALLGDEPVVVAASGVAKALLGGVSAEVLPLDVGDQPEMRRPSSLHPGLVALLDGLEVLLVPIGSSLEPVGYLLCAVEREPESASIGLAISVSEQVSLAIELDRAKADRDLLLIGDERGRIARDLHDLVIQRLFASGLSLQSVVPMIRDERTAERVERVVEELDATIREIRTTIFTLAPTTQASSGLRMGILEVVQECSRPLGFEPATRFGGPIDNAVDPSGAQQVLAVIREALTNVARHAQAERVDLEVSVVAGELLIAVTDDGVGIGAAGRESGLRNLRERAGELEGSFTLAPGPDGGTVLTWQVPVARLRGGRVTGH